MGREIRMVPPNWVHPRMENGNLQPMFDKTFADAATDWKREFAEWESGVRPDYCDDEASKSLEYWEWNVGPPDRAYYRPYSDAEASWFQLWETVTEGTPISPPFATRDALSHHLATKGDNWNKQPWGNDAANAFVKIGWVPSGMSMGGQFFESQDIALAMERNQPK